MNYLIRITYDGSEFQGYATQPHGDTVQDKLEKALYKIFKQSIKTLNASRTDAKVHCYDQVISFDTPFEIEQSKLKNAINKATPHAIYIISCEENIKNIHPRYDCRQKFYQYKIQKKKNPLLYKYSLYIIDKLDCQKMQEGANFFCGTHDFTSFSNVNTNVKNKVRTIYSMQVLEDVDFIYINVIGKSFLYNMIRIIVGTLIEVGRGKVKPDQIKKIIDSKDRTQAGVTINPEGLYLMQIDYE